MTLALLRSRLVWRHIVGSAGRRLDVRIVTLFLGMLLLVQLAGFVTIGHSIDANARAQIANELNIGDKVLRRMLAQNAQRLTDGAKLLAADYGLRDAITSHDQATVVDALHNHGSRIGAAITLFTDLDLFPLSAGQADTAQIQDMVMTVVQSGLAAGQRVGATEPNAAGKLAEVSLLQGQPFQLVTVPVKAPRLVGHVSMGFPIHADLLRDMRAVTALHTVLMTRTHGARWTVLPVGEDAAAFANLPIQLPATAGATPDAEVNAAGEAFSARLVPLASDAHYQVAAALLRSVDEVVAPYRRLQLTLLFITLAGLLAFAVGSLFTARRITEPIKALALSAERLGAGDYSTPVPVTTRDEVRDLAQALEHMRGAVQARQAQVHQLAYWDALTGLPNRAQLREHFGQMLQRADQQDRPCAVLMLDLDRFKHINDVLGTACGDQVLQRIAQRLGELELAEGDMLARLSGDEFALCLFDTQIDAAERLAWRLRSSLERPLVVQDQTVDVGAGVGIALYPQHGRDADSLLGRAEVAMYVAKTRQSGVQVYSPELDAASSQSLSLVSDLRQAVANDDLRMYLQPKVDLRSGRVIGAEALVRWQHPLRGMVQPMQFIPYAEQTGVIRELTTWMIQRCVRFQSALSATGLDLKFAVNLSTRDLMDNDLPNKLEGLLAEHAVKPSALGLEITESGIMEDPQRALATVRRLYDMGFTMSIDDFGTGYSLLAYLKRLPLHELKIDRSFVSAMADDPTDMNIVRSTIDLAHNLGLRVVAEGVENEKIYDLLRSLGCDYAQGYGIAKPMPESAFGAWARDWAQMESVRRAELVSLDS